MKLKSLRMKNVLCYRDDTLPIAPVMTVVTGVSDKGKSVTIRALDQALRNRPAGIDLMRSGVKRGECSETTVEAVADDERPFSVTRLRGKSRNEYALDGTPLLAFGQEVPIEVSSQLKLSPNAFRLQSDGSFMLKENDATVAKMLSSAVGLAQIDAATTKVRKMKAANDADMRVAEADVVRETAAAAKYDGLDEAERLCGEYETHRCAVETRRYYATASGETILAITQLPPDVQRQISEAREVSDTAIQLAMAHHNASVDVETAADMLRRVAACSVPVAAAEIERCLRLEQGARNLRNLCDDTAAQIDRMESLAEALEDVPANAPTTLAKIAVGKLAIASRAVPESAAKCVEIGDMLVRLSRAPIEQNILPADNALTEMSNYEEWVRDRTIERDDAADMLKQLSDLDHDLLVGKQESERIMAEIAQYKACNPICPNCGAEQEHWAN